MAVLPTSVAEYRKGNHPDLRPAKSSLTPGTDYLTPADRLNRLDEVIFAERDRKLEAARLRRQQARETRGEVA